MLGEEARALFSDLMPVGSRHGSAIQQPSEGRQQQQVIAIIIIIIIINNNNYYLLLLKITIENYYDDDDDDDSSRSRSSFCERQFLLECCSSR
jgi:hypothetical protein